MTTKLMPEAKNGLSKFKNNVLGEMGLSSLDYNYNLSSKQINNINGTIIKRMVSQYESGIL